jgi:hypothetical protein
MPLAFNSLSHGEIAFGFFNIETDLLLLDTYFIFAPDFCAYIEAMAQGRVGEDLRMEWEVYTLKNEQIGNLMGAIHGIDLRGFVGDVYRKFPFPKEMKDFAQNPEGRRTRKTVKEIIERYDTVGPVPVTVDAAASTVEVGDYMFSREEFHELLRYVWRGGFPRWKDGIRPDYLLRMKERLAASCHPLFEDFCASI